MERKSACRVLYIMLAFVLLAAALAGCGGKKAVSQDYAETLFDNSRVHSIEITMSETDRTAQLSEPTAKTKYKATVIIDGEEVKDVSFSTKGNSSLFFVADAGKDKFSYGINFGTYEKGRTFHGLDKLNLQNNCADATSMKEYLAYGLFNSMDVAAPLASFAWLTVNGEVQGLYTLLEDVDDSFLQRALEGKGTIYKPEEASMALSDEEMERLKNGSSAAHDTGGGADLAYKDGHAESYPDIFENAETAEGRRTRARVIRALKALSRRKKLDKHLDTAEIIRYFAVHDFLVAYDSYTGPMLHNYILYENGGRLAMLPWDYDLAFGSFPTDASMDTVIDSTEAVNTGIDSPLGSLPDEARPMWNWILSDPEYLAAYHFALSQVTDFVTSGAFKAEAAKAAELIAPYVDKDPKGFYSADRFSKACETLLAFTELRAESVLRQLSGQLATRSELQAAEDRVDASMIDILDMGSMTDLK